MHIGAQQAPKGARPLRVFNTQKRQLATYLEARALADRLVEKLDGLGHEIAYMTHLLTEEKVNMCVSVIRCCGVVVLAVWISDNLLHKVAAIRKYVEQFDGEYVKRMAAKALISAVALECRTLSPEGCGIFDQRNLHKYQGCWVGAALVRNIDGRLISLITLNQRRGGDLHITLQAAELLAYHFCRFELESLVPLGGVLQPTSWRV